MSLLSLLMGTYFNRCLLLLPPLPLSPCSQTTRHFWMISESQTCFVIMVTDLRRVIWDLEQIFWPYLSKMLVNCCLSICQMVVWGSDSRFCYYADFQYHTGASHCALFPVSSSTLFCFFFGGIETFNFIDCSGIVLTRTNERFSFSTVQE